MRVSFLPHTLMVILLCGIALSVAQEAAQPLSLSLEEAIGLALEANPQIRTAAHESEAAAARILQSQGWPDPELHFGLGEIPSDLAVFDAGEQTIGIEQSFEFPGKRETRGKAAKDESAFMTENLHQTQRMTVAKVKQTYYRVWLHQKMVVNLEAKAELLKQFRESAIIRYQAQKVQYLEVLRAQTELAKIQADLMAEQCESQNALADLNRLLGRPGSAPLAITDDLTYEAYDTPLEVLQDEMWQTSAARRMAEALVERSQARLALARKSRLPDFSIGLYTQNLKEQPPFDANDFFGTTASWNWGVDVGLSLPLWSRKGLKGEIDEARAVNSIEQIRYDALHRDLVTATEKAYRRVKTAEAQVRLYEESMLRDADDALRSGIALYQAGQIDALNLIDLYRIHTETMAEYYRSLHNYHEALANLEIANETSVTP